MLKQTIAIIEDETDITELVSYNLNREGFNVISAVDGLAGLALIEKQQPDLVLLDLMLPGIDGLEVCRKMKENSHTKAIPIVMMTAKGDESDIIIGLGIGADDYVAKPFSPKELVARVKAVLRRIASINTVDDSVTNSLLKYGPITINTTEYKVYIDGNTVQMTLSEFKILQTLITKPNRVFTRDELLRETVGDQVVIVDRNIDVHIRSIRKHLGEHKKIIETVRGVGYRLTLAD